MLLARGWSVTVESYTGWSRVTEFVVQTSKGMIGRVKVSHGHAFDGVILVDPATGVGCANIDLGSAAQPDDNGQWKSTLSARIWLTSLIAKGSPLGIRATSSSAIRSIVAACAFRRSPWKKGRRSFR